MKSIGVYISFAEAATAVAPGVLCSGGEEVGGSVSYAHTGEVLIPCSDFERVQSNCRVRSRTLAAWQLLEHLDLGE